MTAYWELLKDPRWQKRRLEIMERAGWACELCGETAKTFNVHHTHYEKGRKPWEYDNDSLKCYCEDCHRQVTEALARANRILGQLDPMRLESAIGFMKGSGWIEQHFGMETGVGITVENSYQLTGVLAAFGIGHLYRWSDIHATGQTTMSARLLEALCKHGIEDFCRRKQARDAAEKEDAVNQEALAE